MTYLIVGFGMVLALSAGFAIDLLVVARGWHRLVILAFQCAMVAAAIVLIRDGAAGCTP